MKTIWKFHFGIADYQLINMPIGAKPLAVQLKTGIPCLWCLVESENEQIPYTLLVRGTGHPVDPGVEYIGSFQMAGGALVWHVFFKPI